jgi:salicylate hydroxylase
MEDGLALGLVMAGITDVSQIPARLKIYEKIRRNRAASIQVISKIGMDEELPPELAQFLEGRNFPGICLLFSIHFLGNDATLRLRVA